MYGQQLPQQLHSPVFCLRSPVSGLPCLQQARVFSLQSSGFPHPTSHILSKLQQLFYRVVNTFLVGKYGFFEYTVKTHRGKGGAHPAYRCIQVLESFVRDNGRYFAAKASENFILVNNHGPACFFNTLQYGVLIKRDQGTDINHFDAFAGFGLYAVGHGKAHMRGISVGDYAQVFSFAAGTCLTKGYFETFGNNGFGNWVVIKRLWFEKQRWAFGAYGGTQQPCSIVGKRRTNNPHSRYGSQRSLNILRMVQTAAYIPARGKPYGYIGRKCPVAPPVVVR